MSSPPVFTERFTVSGYRDRRTPLQLMEAGAYGNVTRRVQCFVAQLPLVVNKLTSVDLEYVRFDFDPKTNDVLEAFRELGLHQPFAEDALRFGIQFGHEQVEGPIAFLHEPWSDRSGWKNVLCLDTWNGKRTLRGPSIRARWSKNHRFAGRRIN